MELLFAHLLSYGLKAYTANFQVILFLDEKTLMCLAYLPFVQLDRTQDYGSWNVGSNPMRKAIWGYNSVGRVLALQA